MAGGGLQDQSTLRAQARQIVASMRGSYPLNTQALNELVKSLPSISEEQLTTLGHFDGQCPICFVPFLSILAEEEMAYAVDSPAHPVEELGITWLERTCKHLFCRKDITKWISTQHDSCPMCRTALVPPSSADTRPIDSIPDREISDSLLMIEESIVGHLEELRRFREAAQRERQGDEPDHDDPPQPNPHRRSPSPPTHEYSGMYS